MSISVATDMAFVDPVLGKDAVYTQGADAPVGVRVMVRQASEAVDVLHQPVMSDGVVISVRKSEVENPQLDATFEIDGKTYTINAAPRLRGDGLVWFCEAPMAT
jgi:hypothetical protein